MCIPYVYILVSDLTISPPLPPTSPFTHHVHTYIHMQSPHLPVTVTRYPNSPPPSGPTPNQPSPPSSSQSLTAVHPPTTLSICASARAAFHHASASPCRAPANMKGQKRLRWVKLRAEYLAPWRRLAEIFMKMGGKGGREGRSY